MSLTHGGICARKTINLNPTEFISDRVTELPSTAGMHLIIAPTGAGKSHAMTNHSATNKGAVIFPVKAVMTQQLEETYKQGINANIYQLERFDNEAAEQVDCIHFDECQLFYEGGFRKDVETFTELLIRQSISKPVYCYSATYIEEIDFVKWDSVTVFDKEFKRECTPVQVYKDDEIVSSGKQIRQFKSAFASAVLAAHVTTNLPALVFVNSKSKCIEIRNEIVAAFPNLKVELSNSEINSESPVISHIMKTSTIGGCGADIILSTSSLEAGININDPVCIVSEQTDANKLFQRFGRARKSGVFFVIGGGGTGEVTLTKTSVTVRDADNDVFYNVKDIERNTLSQYMDQSCRFTNRDHALACDRYTNYINECDSLRNSITVYARLNTLGYTVVDPVGVDISENAVSFKRGSKVSVCQCIRDHIEAGKSLHGADLIELVSVVSKASGVDFMTASVHVQKYVEFEAQMRLVNNIKQDALTVFEKLSATGQSFILSMSMNEAKSDADGFVNALYSDVDMTIKMVRQSAGNVVMTGEKLDDWCDKFWQAVVSESDNRKWFEDENKRTRTNLFRYLMGWVEDKVQKRWVIIDEKAWWDVELDRAEQVKRCKVTKKLADEGITDDMGQVCEHLNMDMKEILNSFSPAKLAKHLKSDADWGV